MKDAWGKQILQKKTIYTSWEGNNRKIIRPEECKVHKNCIGQWLALSLMWIAKSCHIIRGKKEIA